MELEKIQKSLGYSDEKMADVLSISRPTLAKYKSHGVPVEVWVKLSQFLAQLSIPSQELDFLSEYGGSGAKAEELLEFMEDRGLLSNAGKALRHALWVKFVKA